MNLKPIKETKELVRFVAATALALRLSYADKKLDVRDVPHFLTPGTLLPAAISGAGEIPTELRDLTEEEIAEITAEFGDVTGNPVYHRAIGHFLLFANDVMEIAGLKLTADELMADVPRPDPDGPGAEVVNPGRA